MPKKKDSGGGEEGPNKAWLDSYADAMTLLLAFFVMLFAFSSIETEKFLQFKAGLAESFGASDAHVDTGDGILLLGEELVSQIVQQPDGGGDSDTEGEQASEGDEIEPEVVPERPDGETPEDVVDEDANSGEEQGEAVVDDEDEQPLTGEVTADETGEIDRLTEDITGRLDAIGATNYAEVQRDPRGVVIYLEDRVLFSSGDAALHADGATVLNALAPLLTQIDNPIAVEGHTDNVPTSGARWPTNWELSTARATGVLRYLNEATGVPAVRMNAAGYADTRPRATNTTPDGRQRNRRVELVVLIGETEQAPDI
ncbi:MAG: OmpA family protein [Actinomycetota bacterium]|nr:OmpA family protein [Actinomycetota bacterium]